MSDTKKDSIGIVIPHPAECVVEYEFDPASQVNDVTGKASPLSF